MNDPMTCDEHELVECPDCTAQARKLLGIPDPLITIADASRAACIATGSGSRLYVIDDTGDGWRIIVERPLITRAGDGIMLVQMTCDTLQVGEWSNWRSAVLDLEDLSLTWTEPERGDVAEREHVLKAAAIVGGWS